jgi:hypothetical protein
MQLHIFKRSIKDTAATCIGRSRNLESWNNVVNPTQVRKEVYFGAISPEAGFWVEDWRFEKVPTSFSGV